MKLNNEDCELSYPFLSKLNSEASAVISGLSQFMYPLLLLILFPAHVLRKLSENDSK